MDPIGRPALFWMSFPTSIKSLATRLDILFLFVSLSSMLRVGGVEEQEGWREDMEEWVGDNGFAFARAGDYGMMWI